MARGRRRPRDRGPTLRRDRDRQGGRRDAGADLGDGDPPRWCGRRCDSRRGGARRDRRRCRCLRTAALGGRVRRSGDHGPVRSRVRLVPLPGQRPPATPSTRALARRLGVDLALVTGTGPGGRITDPDVSAFHESGSPAPSPVVRGRALVEPRSAPPIAHAPRRNGARRRARPASRNGFRCEASASGPQRR